jgi:glycosyltransferase involved in cell wall biosynthesis
VRFLGWRDDVPALHAAFALFTMSSHSEGMSVSLLEAMAAGLCPVVTDVGGNRAVLGPALAHRLVAPANPLALAGAWESALADPARRAADGQAARQRVQQEFSVQTMVRRYEALYRESSSATTS